MFLGDTTLATTDGRCFISSADSELLKVACVRGYVRRTGGPHQPSQEEHGNELLTPAVQGEARGLPSSPARCLTH